MGLAARPSGRRPSRLSQQDQQRLLGFLEQGPRAHGFNPFYWTAELIVDLVQQKFGVGYHPHYVNRLLQPWGTCVRMLNRQHPWWKR